jgi:hypothetical protein
MDPGNEIGRASGSVLQRIDASPEWRIFEIEADAPEEAGMISFGLYLAGAGAAWLDAVSLEVVND